MSDNEFYIFTKTTQFYLRSAWNKIKTWFSHRSGEDRWLKCFEILFTIFLFFFPFVVVEFLHCEALGKLLKTNVGDLWIGLKYLSHLRHVVCSSVYRLLLFEVLVGGWIKAISKRNKDILTFDYSERPPPHTARTNNSTYYSILCMKNAHS